MSDSSSNLSSEVTAALNSTAETTAINVLSSNLLLNGEPTSSSLANISPYNQQTQQRMPYVEGKQYSLEYGRLVDRRDPPSLSQHASTQDQSHDPLLLQATSSNLASPVVASPHSQFSVPRSFASVPGRPQSKSSNSRPPSFTDLPSSDMQFTGTGLTPTTPVFSSSPFQSTTLAGEISGSPGIISPSLGMEPNVGDKRKLKKPNRAGKEQSDVDKEEKKRKLALEQEKERQWKLLQQQRLKEQQSHHQTPAIQQVMMMKEQMRKENNRSGNRKSSITFPAEQEHAMNEYRSNVLPPVEPFALTHSSVTKDSRISHHIDMGSMPDGMPTSKAVGTTNVAAPGMSVTTIGTPIPSNLPSHPEDLKTKIHQPPVHPISQNAFLLNDTSSRDPKSQHFSFSSASHEPSSEIDSLLGINDSEFARMTGTRPTSDVSTSQPLSAVSLPSPGFPSVPGSQLQLESGHKTESVVTTGRNEPNILITNKQPTASTTVIQAAGVPMPMPVQTPSSSIQSMEFSAVLSQPDNKGIPTAISSQVMKSVSGLLMEPGSVNSAVIQPGTAVVSENFDKQPTTGLDHQQQQQALLFQQQQFMAAQQQYIQWQLQQRNPELFQSITTPVQYSSYADKDLPEVDSEEQHQERIRFLYRQRQMQKQQVVQIQQQMHQQQVYATSHITPSPTPATPRPQMDQTQQQFVQQLMQYQQQIPEAMQQQFLVEYSRQMQQRTDLGQNAMQYEKFLAELAQQYGYPMHQPNAQAVSVMQHGITWPSTAAQPFHSNMQQMFAFGAIDEEKAKEMSPQQLYQLQLQQTLMMHQMAASGMYPAQSNIRNPSPAVAGSRKSSTGSNQSKSKQKKSNTAITDAQKSSRADSETSRSPLTDPKANLIRQGSIAPSPAHSESVMSHDDASSIKSMESNIESTNNAMSHTIQLLSNAERRPSDPLVKPSSRPPSGLAVPVTTNTSRVSSPVISLPDKEVSARASTDRVKEIGLQNDKLANLRKDVPNNRFNNLPATIASSPVLMNSIQSVNKEKSANGNSPTISMNPGSINEVKQAPCTDGIHCGTDSEPDDISAAKKAPCTDGIHCGTDSEDEEHKVQFKKNAILQKFRANTVHCTDGIHCGTDSEDESCESGSAKRASRPPCTDGIHCGTDSEDESCGTGSVKRASKPPCTDGIHCGTDSEDESHNRLQAKRGKKPPCTDGIHCGTDSEGEGNARTPTVKQFKPPCMDGIHCGTDSEDESNVRMSQQKGGRQPCSDGIHCGTDTEDEGNSRTAKNAKPPCADGIHCGTDSEDDCDLKTLKRKSVKPPCSDGIHCGTDSEGEENTKIPMKTKAPCSDGIQCGTDSEEEESVSNPKKMKVPCTDGIHCGTDSEEEESTNNPRKTNLPCSDGIHCGTDSEEETITEKGSQKGIKRHNTSNHQGKGLLGNRVNSCSDGIHCGTDSEDEENTKKNKASVPSRGSPLVQSKREQRLMDQNSLISTRKDGQQSPVISISSQQTVISSSDVRPNISYTTTQIKVTSSTSTNVAASSSTSVMSSHTLEVIQEGDVTQSTFNALENMSRNLKGAKTETSVPGNFSISSLVASTAVNSTSAFPPISAPKMENAVVPTCMYDSSHGSAFSQENSAMKVMTSSAVDSLASQQKPSEIQLSKSVQGAPPHFLPNFSTTATLESSKIPLSIPGSFSQGGMGIKGGLQAPDMREHHLQAIQPQPFSPTPTPHTPSAQQTDPQGMSRHKQKIVGIPPTSPQYQQLFMHQHQLLIMQFQQYQYQLQAQYTQLSQQQMSPQQQFLLQQQYHQQMMLLQRQFVQQQVRFCFLSL